MPSEQEPVQTMQEEEEEEEARTHYDVLRELGDEWGLERDFIRSITSASPDYKEMTLGHALLGKRPGRTGRWECGECDGYLHEEVCKGYQSHVRTRFKWDVIEEYSHRTCLKCEEPIEDTRTVEEVVAFEAEVSETSTLSEPPETEYKTQYLPCEHIFDTGEELFRADIDREAIQRDVDRGKFRYDGRAVKPLDGLTEYEHRLEEDWND